MKPRLARVIRIGTFVSALVIAGTATANEPINLAVDNEDTEIDANERSPVAAALTSETPPGFEDLADPMPVVVDIYFGGRLIGTT